MVLGKLDNSLARHTSWKAYKFNIQLIYNYMIFNSTRLP